MLHHVLNLDAKLDAVRETLGAMDEKLEKLDRLPTYKQMCASCAAALRMLGVQRENSRESERQIERR